MPDRVIRDELLTSERYWRCSPEARCLYVSILLCVDDAARYTAAPFALRTRCMAGTVSHERIEAILAELIDCDLVRRYEVNGKAYLFVPRFRNRRRYVGSSKYPAPPSGINDMALEKSDLGQTQDGLESDSSQTQDRRGRRGVGEKQLQKHTQRTHRAARIPLPPGFEISERVRTWAVEHGHDRLEQRLEAFIGYAKSSGAVYADWDEAFMQAIRQNWAHLPEAEPVKVRRLAL